MPDNKLAVIGAGITGLVTALAAQKKGIKTDVFERKAEPGGSVKTVSNGDWKLEYGPNTLLLKDREVADFLVELGLHPDTLTANPAAANRFIVRDGVLEPLPDSVYAAIGTDLFGLKAKFRVLKEPFVGRGTDENETIAGFTERRLGREILDYAINPFVAGIFANNPEDLSVRHAFPALYNLEKEHGSLVWGSIAGRQKRREAGRIARELISFSEGMQQLPQKIATRLETLHYNQQIVKLAREEGDWFLVSRKRTFGPYKKVVVNSPLYMLGDLAMPMKAEGIRRLREVKYPPLSVIHAGFRKEDVQHTLNGFGFLVPEAENRNILGALFSSTLFKGRAPEGHHLLTVFVGGGRQPGHASLPTGELIDLVTAELAELIGVTAHPVFTDHVYWPHSIPAYGPGYDEVLEIIQTAESQNPGLHFAGNFRGGISLPDCIKNGLALGSELAKSFD